MGKATPTSDHAEEPSKQVLVCRNCGRMSPEDSARCINCWSSHIRLAPVAEKEGRRLALPGYLGFLRRRYLRLILALALGLIIWRVAVAFDLGPLILSPPEASTSISASTGLQTWAQARRTPESTGFTPDPGPLSPSTVKWAYATSEPIFASPAVVGDRVYLTTGDGRGLALDRESGRLVWEYLTGVPSATTPAVAGDLVFFGLRNKRFIALNRETGELRWETDLGNPVLASAIVMDGTVYIGSTDKKLYALDAATGRTRWSFTKKGWIVSPVAFFDNSVAVASRDGVLHILEARTGRKRFVFDAGLPIMGGPAIAGDGVYFVSNRGTVWSVDRHTVSYPFERAWWTVRFNLYAWGFVPSVSGQKGTIWGNNVGARVVRSLAIANDTVYVADRNGKLHALDAGTGERRWTKELGTEISADPTVAGGTVLVGTDDGTLYGLDPATGEDNWTFKTGGKITAGPVVAGDTIYVASHDGVLYALTSGE